MLTKQTLIRAIGSTEPSTLNEILRGLEEDEFVPTSKEEWRKFFSLLDEAELEKLVRPIYAASGKFVEAQLTELGVEWLKQF